MLRTIPYAQTRTEAERLRTEFTRWCRDHSYEAACVTLERDWDRMITFYDFPKEHWQHLRTTNPVESPFAALRLRTDAAKRYKRVLSDPKDGPRFWVVHEWWIRQNIYEQHEKFLECHGGVRPRNPNSTHHSIAEDRIAEWKDRWDILKLW